jgi:hypothetical protein
MRRKAFNKKKVTGGATTSFIYDISPTYRSDSKFTIKRDSDNFIETFTPDEIINGTYSAFLNGANGILTNLLPDRGNIIPEIFNNVGILETGYFDFTLTNTIRSDQFGNALPNNEMPERYIAAFVPYQLNNSNNQRSNINWKGNASGISVKYVFNKGTTYRRNQAHFCVERAGQAAIHQYFTATNYNNSINNIIVIEVTPTEINFMINGILINNGFDVSDNNWTGYTWTPYNCFSLGNRYGATSQYGSYKHFSLHLDPAQTLQEIHDELKAIYQ